MFKKLTALFIALSVIFGFAGCAEEKPEHKETNGRWYTEYTDTLIPRDDYGELFIFTGGYVNTKNGYIDHRFGLMTLDGRIVVDPLYTHYQKIEHDGTEYYCMKYIENELYEGGEFYCESTLMKTDGSWALKLEDEIESVSDNRIITSKYGSYYTVYDYEGNLIFKGEGKSSVSSDGFCNGVLVTYENTEDDLTDVTVFDENGNKLFEEFAYCGAFANDMAVASLDSESYGLISKNGEWLLEPIYDSVYYAQDENQYRASIANVVHIYGPDLKLITTKTVTNNKFEDYNRKYFESEQRYYKHTKDDPDGYIRDAFTDEIITCRKNKLPATEYIATFDSENPLFSARDEKGTLWIFDKEGKLFKKFKSSEYAGFDSKDFYWVSSGNTTTYYNAKTHKKVHSVTGTSDDENIKVSVSIPTVKCDYLIEGHLEFQSIYFLYGTYDLYNYKTGEYVFTDCRNCIIEEFKDRIYITVIYEDEITIYDENLNKLTKTENACKNIGKEFIDMDSLALGKNRGELAIYMGGYKHDEENGYNMEKLYGLMAKNGEILTQPLYNWYQIFELNGETYYCLKYSENNAEHYDACLSSLLVKADGTRGAQIPDNIVCVSENRIIGQQLSYPFTVYDYDAREVLHGNKKQSIDNSSNGYYNGLLVVHDFVSDTPNTMVYNKDGHRVLEGFDYCGPFVTNKAVASYNREEGYGIISADGKWLLDPVYDDIQTVDGKYFIAVDFDNEYIYDSDLTLLRKRERGDFEIEKNYFFESDSGRLLRYYAHIDSPDNFYRDAFTDEIISCDGINATGYMEYLGLFYNVDEDSRTAIVCNENGKLLNKAEKVDRITEYDGIYCAEDFKNGVYTYYSGKTHQKLITLNCKANEWKPVTTVGDCGLLAIGNLEDKMDTRFDGPYDLYDYKKSEYVFENCEYCEINEYGGNVYVTVVYKDRIETYDSNLNLLIKTENMCEK